MPRQKSLSSPFDDFLFVLVSDYSSFLDNIYSSKIGSVNTSVDEIECNDCNAWMIMNWTGSVSVTDKQKPEGSLKYDFLTPNFLNLRDVLFLVGFSYS